MPWTEEKINLMLSLNVEGYSSTQIAGMIGDVSRNAVIGKLSRMKVKMSLARSPFSRPQEPRIRKPRGRIIINGKKKSLPIEDVDVSREEGKTLLELNGNDCRWPFGDDSFYFCGRETEPGKSYCPSHSSLSCTRATEPTNVAKTFYGFRR